MFKTRIFNFANTNVSTIEIGLRSCNYTGQDAIKKESDTRYLYISPSLVYIENIPLNGI